MKRNEIKRTVEEVVRVEYIAEDGQVFYNEDECKKYEESALFAVSKQLKRLHNKYISKYDLNEDGCEDNKIEIFDIPTEQDLENLRRYLYLTLKKNGASESDVEECFTSKDGKRKDFVFDGVTIGHEVIICWNYDCNWFWTYKDGSIEGYLGWLRDRITKLITPEIAISNMFTTAEINKAKELAYKNSDKTLNNEGSVGFEFNGQWISNPFLEESGRFEFANYETMCKHYGLENVENFIRIILLLK